MRRVCASKTGISLGLALVLATATLMTGVLFAEEPAAAVPAAEAGAPPAPAPSVEESAQITSSPTGSQNVTLDFSDADIRNVLKILALKAGINIVFTPEVVGNVSIRLVDVPWTQALDTIVKTAGFGFEWLSNKIIMVSTLERLAKQRKEQQDASDIEPMDTQVFILNFTKASELAVSIEKILTPERGKLTVEQRSNSLIVTDTKSNLIKISAIVQSLDKPTPQVAIEAKIIETTLGSSEQLGIDWSTVVKITGTKRPTFFPFSEKVNDSKLFPKIKAPAELERVSTVETSSTGDSTVSQEEKVWNELVRGFPEASSSLYTFGSLDFTGVQIVLNFLKGRSGTKIIASPSITTLNNQQASMFVGRIVPIPTYEFSKETGTQIISGYQDQQIGINLLVTPNINERSFITLKVAPQVQEIVGSTGPNGERPVMSTRSADTTVMVKDGHTLVIGGLIQENKTDAKRGIPFIGELPVLDLIFGSKSKQQQRTELIIFITPRIVDEARASEAELERIRLMTEEVVPEKKSKKAKKEKK